MAINMNATTGKKTLHKMWYGDGNQIKCSDMPQVKGYRDFEKNQLPYE